MASYAPNVLSDRRDAATDLAQTKLGENGLMKWECVIRIDFYDVYASPTHANKNKIGMMRKITAG